MSLCFKTRADPAFLSDCCLNNWPLGISQSVGLSLSIARLPNYPILAEVGPNNSSLPDPLTVSNTVQVNPFQMACDPRWCKGSSACDPILYEECRWSITTILGTSRSALLAPEGVCGEWYRNFVAEGLLGTNSFVLIDSIVNEYCIKSATALGDTTSCACVNPDARNFYVWYSDDGGLTSNTYQVTAVNSNSFDSIAVSDFVCTNPFCIQAFQQETSFITSGLLARKTTCPTQTCMQVNLGLIVSATSIASGGYVSIGSTDLLCGGPNATISSGVPLLELLPLNDVWFYNGNTEEYLNPDNQAAFVYRNLSPIPTNVELEFGNLPAWLTPVTNVFGYPVAANSTNLFLFAFDPELAPGPIAVTVNVTISAVDSSYDPFDPPARWTSSMNLSIVDISLPVPEQPPPPKPRTDELGLPLSLIDRLTVGGIAMIVLSACLIIYSVFLLFNNVINKNAAS